MSVIHIMRYMTVEYCRKVEFIYNAVGHFINTASVVEGADIDHGLNFEPNDVIKLGSNQKTAFKRLTDQKAC